MTDEKNLIFGVNPVLERFKLSLDEIREVLVSDKADHGALEFIKSEAKRHGLRVVSVAPKSLDSLVGNHRHQGVVVRVDPYRYISMEDLLRNLSAGQEAGRLLILDGLTDPRNFGALLRTAEGVGVRYVVIPKDRSVDVTPIVVKTSAGASQYLKIAKVTNLRQAVIAIKRAGYWVVGLEAESPQSIYETTFPSKIALLLGSEGKGIRPLVKRECDFLLSIPMMGNIASLNVAVAGAVFLYEVLRQTRNIDKVISKR